LASTFNGRVANNGNFEYKSTTIMFGQDSSPTFITFLEWSVRNLHTTAGAKGMQSEMFSFGASVPVVMSEHKDENGKLIPNIQYERIGISASRVGLIESVPTLIGTLNLPGTS